MAEENTIEVINNYEQLIAEGKNKLNISCTKCPSKILPSTMGQHTIIEVNNLTDNCQFVAYI